MGAKTFVMKMAQAKARIRLICSEFAELKNLKSVEFSQGLARDGLEVVRRCPPLFTSESFQAKRQTNS
jgi:hypothetical protein